MNEKRAYFLLGRLCENRCSQEGNDIFDALVREASMADLVQAAITMYDETGNLEDMTLAQSAIAGVETRYKQRIAELKKYVEQLRADLEYAHQNVSAANASRADVIKDARKLQAEVETWHEAYDAQQVSCAKCGNTWWVPKGKFGNPIFDCPKCKAAEAGGEK